MVPALALVAHPAFYLPGVKEGEPIKGCLRFDRGDKIERIYGNHEGCITYDHCSTNPQELCDNQLDDDGDGRIDCDDSDCIHAANCLAPTDPDVTIEICDNKLDDDGEHAGIRARSKHPAGARCAGGGSQSTSLDFG